MLAPGGQFQAPPQPPATNAVWSWDGLRWNGSTLAAIGALLAANNLSDLVNAATARTNLGLGSIATQAASAVAITGGNIDGTAIGSTTRNTLQATTGDFNSTLAIAGTTTCAALNASGAITSSNLATENRFTINDSTTAGLPTVFVLNHTTSATPANGFGVSMTWRASDSTTASVDMAYVYASWATAAHATRKARLQLDVNDAGGERSGITIDTDGSGAQIALFGAGSYGGGRQVVFFANSAAVPSSNPTGGGVLYADAGALKWRGSSGTVTTIAAA